METNFKKRNKGITLVALVITIILLLILAGISIATLTGSGLFENARLADQKSKNAQELEDITLKDYEKKIGEYVDSNRDTVTISKQEYQEIMEKIENIEIVEEGTYTFSTLGAKTHGYGLLFNLNVPSNAEVTFTSVNVKSINSSTVTTYSNEVLLLSKFGNQRTYNINDSSYSEGALGLVTITFNVSY